MFYVRGVVLFLVCYGARRIATLNHSFMVKESRKFHYDALNQLSFIKEGRFIVTHCTTEMLIFKDIS
jgi:hypothetical protein